MALSLDQKRLLVLLRNRALTDTFAWLLLLLLIIGYIPIHLYSWYIRLEGDGYDNFLSSVVLNNTAVDVETGRLALRTIVCEAMIYLFAIMLMVYLNLIYLKKRILDPRLMPWRNVLYIASVVVLAALLSFIWMLIDQQLPNLLRLKVEFTRMGVVNVAFALISTGLVFLKELKDVQMKHDEMEAELLAVKKELEDSQITLFTNHIKVGSRTNWDLVNFDDILVVANDSLPRKYTEKLEPWDMENLVPYTEEYLSGFSSERYSVGLAEGFDMAKDQVDNVIVRTIKRDIGGDEQRVHRLDDRYSAITFKHVLLPLWLASFRYNNKPYRVVINGRTGAITGERPYSWIKIAVAAVAALAVIGAIAYVAIVYGDSY